MNKILFSFLAIVMTTTMSLGQSDSITYTPGYTNDVFYSLSTGMVKSEMRANWDIAFTTSKMSSSLLINEASGVELYTYPGGDTAAWNNMDTSGFSTWKPMHNSEDSWEEGAFGTHAIGHPDYGWGTYNMVTHNVTGDSIFLIKTRSGMFKKLWIISKQSALNINTYRYADLDGNNDTTVILDGNPYMSKNFVYYDLESNLLLDREPASSDWDILFTKYSAKQSTGGYYMVTGVLLNYDTYSSQINMTDTSISNWSDNPMSDSMSTIGWDWKAFNMTSFTYEVEDSLVYFIQNQNGDVFKLIFTGFDGSTTGNVYFNKQLLSATSIADVQSIQRSFIYPNPAQDYLNIINPQQDPLQVEIYNLSGSLMEKVEVNMAQRRINISHLPAGVYFVNLRNQLQNQSIKIIVQ
jgi:hypothetical protein